MSENNCIDRRGFLGIATWSIGGLISILMGVPAITYVLGPALSTNDNLEWVQLGSIKKVDLGTPTLFKTKIIHQTGWTQSEETHSIYILTDNGREYIAISNICTHLGCRVRWISEKQQFYCPCHVGIFDKQGYVISGPPPRPLDRYELKIENDQLFIGRQYQVEG